MNKIYKVKWSKVKQQHVVVSELVHSNGKQGRTPRKRKLRSRIATPVVCGAAIAAFGILPPHSQEAFAANATVQQAAQSHYVAFKETNTSSSDWKSGTKTVDGITFKSQQVKLSDGRVLNYWVREGYTLKAIEGVQYIPDRLMKTDDVGGHKSDYIISAELTDPDLVKGSAALRTTESSAVGTMATTTRNDSLEKVEVGHYTGVSNSAGVGTDVNWDYIIDPVGEGNFDDFIDITSNSKDAWSSGYLKEVEFKGNSYYLKGTNQKVDSQNVYIIGDKAGAFVTKPNGNDIYTGRVYGAHNEVLMTGKGEDGDYYTFWAGKVDDDDNVLLSDSGLTVGDYRDTVDTFYRNDRKLSAADIKSVKVDENKNSINLITNTQFDENGEPIKGTEATINGFTVKSVNNTGKNTEIEFSDGENNYFCVDAGSRVEGFNGDEFAKPGDTLTALNINGQKYDLGQGKTYTNSDGISISNDNKISVNAGDGLIFGTEGTKDGQLEVNVGEGLSIADDGKVVNNLVVKKAKESKIYDPNKNHFDGGAWTITDKNQDSVLFANTTLSSEVESKNEVTNGETEEDKKVVYGKDYTVSDTDGNTAIFEDVASAKTLKNVDRQVGINTANIGDLRYNDDSETTIVTNGENLTKSIGKLDEALSAGWFATDDNNNSINVNPSENTLNFSGDNNIAVSADSNTNTIQVRLKPIVTLNREGFDGNWINLNGVKGTINATNRNTNDGNTNPTTTINEFDFSNGGKFVTTKETRLSGTTTSKVGHTAEFNEDGATFTETKGVWPISSSSTNINGGKIEISSDTKAIVIDGNTGYMTGLSNTTWNDDLANKVANNPEEASKAATQGQLQQAVSTVSTEASKHTIVSTNDNNLKVTNIGENGGPANYQISLNPDVTLSGNDISSNDNSIELNGTKGTIHVNQKTTDGNFTTNISGSNISIGYSDNRGNGRNNIFIDGGSGTITGLTNTEWHNDESWQKNVKADRAATEGQLQEAVSNIEDNAYKGWSISTNKGNPINVLTGGTVDFSNTDKNIEIGQNGTNLTFDLNNNITLGDGNNQIQINGAPKGKAPAFKIGNKFVVDQDGTTTIIANNRPGRRPDTKVTIAPDGVSFTDNNKGTTKIEGQKISAGGIIINGESNPNVSTIEGLTNRDIDDADFATKGRAATEEQLKIVSDKTDEAINKAGKHTQMTVNGGTEAPSGADEGKYNTDGNLQLKKTEKDGQTTYDVKLNDDITLGDYDNGKGVSISGTNGTIGVTNSITVGDPSGSHVTIDGESKSITGLGNTEWKNDADWQEENVKEDRAATEGQLSDVYNTAVKYDYDKDEDEILFGSIHLEGKDYQKGNINTGTHIYNVAYASGKDGSEAVNVDYLNDAIENVSKQGARNDRHLVKNPAPGSNGEYTPDENGDIDLVVAAKNGKHNTVTITDVAKASDVGDRNYSKVGDTDTDIQDGDDVTTAIGKIDNRIDGIDSRIDDIDDTAEKANNNTIVGGRINEEDGSISLETKDGTEIPLENRLSDSVLKDVDDSKLQSDGEIILISRDKYDNGRGITSQVTLQDVASKTNLDNLTNTTNDLISTVGASTTTELKESYKGTNYINGSETMVDADVALDSAIHNVQQTSYANDMYLNQRIDNVEDRLGSVESRIDKVGAMAAAIANLRSMGYVPEAPTEIAIGVGQYKSETGIALGIFHYPNRDFMLSASISTSGDEVMGGVGATWKLGRKTKEKAKNDESHILAKVEEINQAAKRAEVKEVNVQSEKEAEGQSIRPIEYKF